MKTKENKNDLLRIEEAARRLRVSPGYAYKLARENKIPLLKIGGIRRVPRRAFERLLQEGNSKRAS